MSPCGVSNYAIILSTSSLRPINRLSKFVAMWVGASCGVYDLAQRVRNVFEEIDWQRSDFRVWRHLKLGFRLCTAVSTKRFFFPDDIAQWVWVRVKVRPPVMHLCRPPGNPGSRRYIGGVA